MAKKKSSKNGKKNGKKESTKNEGSIWPLVIGILLLVVIIGAILLLTGNDEYPVETTYNDAVNAFRARGLSEIIIPDLSADFASTNYTLSELKKRYPGYEEDILAVNELLKESEGDVVAIVNGKSISRSELKLQTSLLPEQYRLVMTEDQILEQMINEELLLQDATARGIEPSTEEMDAAYQEILDAGNLTEEALKENLATYNLNIEDLQRMLTKQLTINKLFKETVDKEITVSPEEVRAFYDANPESFNAPEEVTVKHILIATSDERDTATARSEAEAALARYEAGEDFCTLVKELSDDPGSKANCGEYTFGRGLMVPPFEEAAFDMEDGETRVVDTSFGSHVMLKVNHTASKTPSFEEVSSSIEEQLLAQKQADGYQQHITDLREKADIKVLLNETAPAAPESTEPAMSELPAETPVESEEPTVVDNEVKKESEPIEVTVVEGEQKTQQEPADSASFATCLTEKGATLYVASWATASTKEREKFGDEAADLTVVDCSEGCDDVDMFPTWKIGNDFHPGSLSFEELATMTGCTLE